MSLRLLLLALWSMALLQGAISLAADNCIDATDLPPLVLADTRPYIQLRDGRLVESEKAYKLRGINYYPAQTPWRRFLLESDMREIRSELALIRAAGFNALRIFLWNGALFPCDDAPDRPSPAAFERLDYMMRLAVERDFRLIVTLNDMPDLTQYPLYDNPSHLREQTESSSAAMRGRRRFWLGIFATRAI